MCLPFIDLEKRRISKGDSAGFEFEIVANRMGYLCGYVKVLPGHPWFGQHYDDIDASAHGGLTFTDAGKPCPTHGAEDEWWVGFDCAHAWDLPNPDLVDPSEREYTRGYAERFGVYPESSFKDETYVRNECESLCAQAAAAAVPA